MDEKALNPYATPQSLLQGASAPGEVFRKGEYLIVPRASAPHLPFDTCFKCGRPSVIFLRRTLYWHPPGLYILIFPLVLPYVLAGILFRKRMTLTLGLCRKHKAFWHNLLAVRWLSFVAAIVAPCVRIPGWIPEGSFAAGFLLLVFSFVLAWFTSNALIRPISITKEEGAFAGAGEGYLIRFPRRLISNGSPN